MQKIKILSVGRLKEPFYKAAAAEYAKRLSRYMKLTALEVKDEKAPERLSASEADAVKRREGEALLSHVCEGDYVIALDLGAKQLSSEGFAALIERRAMERGDIAFCIGGSLGLHANVLERANMRLSLSEMTFCHQLAHVVLMEQLYRACKINAGETYHK